MVTQAQLLKRQQQQLLGRINVAQGTQDVTQDVGVFQEIRSVQLPTNRGGGSVQLTPSEAQEVQELVNAALRRDRARGLVFLNREPRIAAAGRFILAETLAGRRISQLANINFTAPERRRAQELVALNAGAVGQTQEGGFIFTAGQSLLPTGQTAPDLFGARVVTTPPQRSFFQRARSAVLSDVERKQQQLRGKTGIAASLQGITPGFIETTVNTVDFAASTPGLRLLIQPRQTSQQIVGGFTAATTGGGITRSIIADPGKLEGQLLFNILLNRGLKGRIGRTGRIKTTVSRRRIPTRRSISAQVGKATQIGVDPVTGAKVFRVNTVVKTNILNARTGKVIRTINTETVSVSVTAPTKTEAIRVASRTVGGTARQPRTFRTEGRRVQTFDIAEATGVGLVTRRNQRLLTGNLDSLIDNIGIERLRGQLTRGGTVITRKRARTRTPTRAQALTNIKQQKIVEKRISRQLGLVKIRSTDAFAQTKALTDIIPLNVRVRGFTRRGRRVSPSTRAFPSRVRGGQVRRERSDTDFSRGITKISSDVEISLGTGRRSRAVRPRPSRTDKVSGVDTSVQVSKIINQRQAAQLAAEVQATQIAARTTRLSRTTPRPRTQTRQTQRQFNGLLSGVTTQTRQRAAQATTQRQRQRQRQVSAAIARVNQITTTVPLTTTKTRQSTRTLTGIRTTQQQLQIPRITNILLGTPTFAPPSRTPPPTTTTTTRVPPIILPGSEEDRLFRRPRRRVPYDVFIKRKKIADNLTKQNARNFGAFVVDNSTAAQYTIRRSKGKIKQPPIKVPRNYAVLNSNKFRSFRRRGGKIIQLQNTRIERRNRRIDTGGEVAQLSAARFIKRQRKATNTTNRFNRTFRKLI